MARSWFSLSKQPRFTPITHSFGDNFVRVSSTEETPIATIFDNDVLLFCISQLVWAVNRGYEVSRRIRFTGWDFFRFIGAKAIGGSDYEALWRRMERLNRTLIQTNLRIGKTEHEHAFHWFSEIHRVKEGDKHLGFDVVLPEWLYQSIVTQKSVLTLDEGYFRIRGGMERFLYMWARKSAGNQRDGWSESPDSLYLKSGSLGSYGDFSRTLRRFVDRGSILTYKIESVRTRRSNQLLFTPIPSKEMK